MKIKSLFIKIGSLFKRKHNIFFDAQNVIELTSNTLDIERYFRRVAHYSLNKIVEFGVRGAKNILKKNTTENEKYCIYYFNNMRSSKNKGVHFYNHDPTIKTMRGNSKKTEERNIIKILM